MSINWMDEQNVIYSHSGLLFNHKKVDFTSKGPSSQSCGFSSSHVQMWELDYKESWVPKNWCFWTVVLEKTVETPLDCKEIQPVHPKGDQSWVFIERTDVEAETPILWPPDAKSWLIGKDPDAGRDWRQEEKGTTEEEMVGWHHRHNGHEFWVGSRNWWWTGKPGVLQSMGSQRVRHDWGTELKKEWSTNRCHNVDEPSKHYAKWKKLITKGHVFYDSIYVKCPKFIETEVDQ